MNKELEMFLQMSWYPIAVFKKSGTSAALHGYHIWNKAFEAMQSGRFLDEVSH